MEKSSLDYREKLYSQIQEEYGKLVYTYTCHFKMADRLSKRNFWIKWGQIGLSAISTGGFLGVLISNKQILLWAGGLCSTALLALTSYLKDKDISTEKTDHIKTANKLWKVREKYLSLLTDFDEISIEEIVRKRDELLDESSEIYGAAPLTDGKSYAAAQAALKTNEEQFFTQEELNKMLPAHLRKMSKWGMNTLSLYVQRNGEVISADSRSLISKRYCTVTSAMNREFWNITSDRQNSIYVGSYGRGTAIDTSDIDILMSLPESYYNQFNSVYGNGQSRLLQAVRQAILVPYPRSEVRADGQVVKINFSDGMFFEILPAFKNWDGSYRYPDTNMGGNWRSTNPKAEQDAMKNKNISSNGLLFDTCKHLRYVRDNYFRSYHLSGIVIDSFVYQAIGNWRWLSSGESSTSAAGTYERILLDCYNQHFMWGAMPLSAPGSNQQVSTDNSRDCLGKVLRYIAD